MEKPESCLVCAGVLEQPATGRPKRYCSATCRRSAEYELRRVHSQLATAEKAEMRARAAVAAAHEYQKTDRRRVARFWVKEVERLRARLGELLGGAGDEG